MKKKNDWNTHEKSFYIVITIISYTTTDPVNKPQWLKTKPKHQKKKPHQKTKQNPKHHTNNKQNNKQTNSSITLIKFPGMYYKINRRTSSPLEYNYVRMYAIIHADLHLINILNRSNTSLWYISYLLSSHCKSNRLCLMTLKHG